MSEDNEVTNRKELNVKLRPNGSVLLQSYRISTFVCRMNLRYFPFDVHICRLGFLHGTRPEATDGEYREEPGISFQIQGHILNKDFYLGNDEWSLGSTTFHNVSRITTVYSYNITYPYLEISLELQRKPSFYVIILIIPSILIASLSASGLLLPSEAGEKVSVQMTALLSYMLLFLLVVDILPPVGGNFPIIGELTESLQRKRKKS